MDVSLVSNPFLEDADMETWPCMEDALDQSDCWKLYGQLPGALHIAKDCLMNDQATMMTMRREGNASPATAEAAMAMGAGRAAGVLSQAGADAFTRVRTSVLRPRSTARCFELAFPPPVAPPKASLHFSSTSMDRARQPFSSPGKEALNSCVRSGAANSTSGIASSRQPDFCPRGRERIQQGTGFCSPPTFRPNQDVNAAKEKVEHCLRDASSAITESERMTASLLTVDIPSCWRSDISTEKNAKEVSAVTPKDQTRPAEDNEQQSEVVEAEAKAQKPPSGRSSLTKRTRAAEIHNLSERKRRDKINLRMKALQELIPNANKTDKASVLDEAIEYMKMLQAQVQFMSKQTGMVFPPMMMPSGMQYLSLPETVTVFPHTGMPMGTAMGMAGVCTAGDGTRLPVHGLSLSNPVSYTSGFQSSSTSLVLDEAQADLQNSDLYEPRRAIRAHQQQHPILFSTQTNAHMYGPLLQMQQQTQENGGSLGI